MTRHPRIKSAKKKFKNHSKSVANKTISIQTKQDVNKQQISILTTKRDEINK